VPHTAVTANLNQSADIKVCLFSEIAFNRELTINDLTNLVDLFLGQIVSLDIMFNPGLIQYLFAIGRADSKQIL
jgi:hypothetical protein